MLGCGVILYAVVALEAVDSGIDIRENKSHRFVMLRGIEVEEFPFRVAPIFENNMLTRSMTRGGEWN